MIKKITSIFIVMTLFVSSGAFVFASEGSANIEIPTLDAVSDIELKLDIEEMAVGDFNIDIQPLIDATGEEVGKITIKTTKLADAPQPFSIGIQDYWRADGTYRSEVSVTGDFVFSDATFNSVLDYRVMNGCSNLRLNDADISHDFLAPFPWLWDPEMSDPTTITVRTGTDVMAEASFYYYYETPMGNTGFVAPFETGVRILPSDPGYVRVWVEVFD